MSDNFCDVVVSSFQTILHRSCFLATAPFVHAHFLSSVSFFAHFSMWFSALSIMVAVSILLLLLFFGICCLTSGEFQEEPGTRVRVHEFRKLGTMRVFRGRGRERHRRRERRLRARGAFAAVHAANVACAHRRSGAPRKSNYL